MSRPETLLYLAVLYEIVDLVSLIQNPFFIILQGVSGYCEITGYTISHFLNGNTILGPGYSILNDFVVFRVVCEVDSCAMVITAVYIVVCNCVVSAVFIEKNSI